MNRLHILWVLLINVLSSDATTYHLKVRTSKWPPHSGTGEDIEITLFGTTGKTVAQRYSGWGLHLLERGMVNDFSLDGEDIGSIVNVRVKIIQTGHFFDTWRLFWIEVNVNNDRYKATFEHTFKYNGHSTDAKVFEVVSCREGYQPAQHNRVTTCLDRNECLVTCKESGQVCTNLPGTYKCQCQPGYYLDGTVCRDYDECSSHQSNPCRFSNVHCVNLPGDYECRCNKGYQGDYFACQDKNECQLGEHECTQNCINTLGSFKCGCNAGFKLAVDGKTCLDIDECKGANSCNTTTSVCYDEYGSHRCVCKVGYREQNILVGQVVKKQCVPVECKPLQNLDKSIQLSPQRCMNGKNFYGEECSVNCAAGYELAISSAKKLKCTDSGFVSIGGRKPECKPKPCPALATPNFGYTVPLSCSSSGTTQGKQCYMYCDEGFILAGPRSFKCDQQRYDHDSSTSLCTRIPKITCPHNIHVTLPSSKGRIALGNNFPFFRTSLRHNQVTANIKGVGPTYAFPVGYNVIVYTAKNEINKTDTCSFVVQVYDKTPPVVEFCPSSLTFVSKGGAPVNVTWKEPRFRDNVKIDRIDVHGDNGIMRSPTSFNVMYRAVDSSGNTATCQFTVYFKILECKFDSISGGDNFTSHSCFSFGTHSLCTAYCLPGKTFDIINSNHPLFKFMWFCEGGNFGVDRMPDCVDFIPKNGACPRGYKEVVHYQTKANVCGKCPRGTYYSNGECEPCPKNTYQSNQGSMSCEKCKLGYGTITERNKLPSDCKAFCPRGYVSKTGLSGSCTACPKDTYADEMGSKSCKKCPNGTATNGHGRSSINDCLYAPKNIRMLPAGTMEVSAGDDVQFDCLAEGLPVPFLLIRKEKGLANPNSHSLLPLATKKFATKGLRYRITKVTSHDSGIYSCKAENIKGNAYAEINLVVTEGSGMAPAI